MTDLARRVHNHNWKLDPIVRSLLDTDFYKLLMQQFILEVHPGVDATFTTHNRTKTVRLADMISIEAVREQLDHARTLRFAEDEIIWLAGNTFYGRTQMFKPEYIKWLRQYQLPEYEIRIQDGQYEIDFGGRYSDTTAWEIHSLAILNELHVKETMKSMGLFQLDIMYSRAKAKLWDKIERLQDLAKETPLKIADFGTRRRHGFLWQKWCNEALRAGLGASYIGTSNVLLAKTLGVSAIGTNGHELAMVQAALANSDEELSQAPYKVLDDWGRVYGGNLEIMLPDTFGTTSFLQRAPARFADWTGARPDSKDPIEGGEELIGYWKAHGKDPREKLLVLADSMDVGPIEKTARHFRGRVKVSHGWGTYLTNDFRGCASAPTDALDPISLVNKVCLVNGRPAVKLSDNLRKMIGPEEEIARYQRVFGTKGMAEQEVFV